MRARVATAVGDGAEARPAAVEVAVTDGPASFQRSGQPDVASRETRDRIRAAIISSGLEWPDQRIDVDLTPELRRAAGSVLDLPIAIGVLAASGQLELDHDQAEPVELSAAVGELGLDGSIKPVEGLDELARAVDAEMLIVPEDQVDEIRSVGSAAVRSAASLGEAVSVAQRWHGTREVTVVSGLQGVETARLTMGEIDLLIKTHEAAGRRVTVDIHIDADDN